MQKLERDCSDKERRLEEFLIYLATQKGYRALSDSNALAIHAEDHHDGTQATPLEVLGSNMDHNENFKKIKSLLHTALNGRVTRRRDKNFTIVPQKPENPPIEENQPEISMENPEDLRLSPILAPNEDNSFLSIDAFDFADEDLDLDRSR